MRFGVITLPKNSNKLLIYFLITWILFEDLLVSGFGAPSMIRYLNDGIMLLLAISCLMNANRVLRVFRQTRYTAVLLLILLYVFYTLFGSIINGVPLLQVLWAARNNYRFFAFFVICVYALDRKDIQRLVVWLCQLQWLNLALGLFEFFIFHKRGDYLGGIFGMAKGGNAGLNVYLCFVTACVVLQYLYKQRPFRYLVCSLLATMLLAGLAELKIVFVEIVLIVLMILFLSGRKKQAFTLLGVSAAALAVGLLIMWQLFPKHFAILTDLDRLLEYSVSEDGGYNLSRFHAFSNINRLFFRDSVFRNLFGFGFGYCEYSSFDFLTSNFYRQYGFLNYRWFAHQMMFLETGYVGLALYIAILASILLCAWRSRKKDPATALWNYFVMIMCVITVINLWYNAAIRAESGYLIYFALSVGAVMDQKMDDKKEGLMV